MPTATSISGWPLVNVGPLTTTFTAPASCSTAAYRTGIALAQRPDSPLWGTDCERLPPADCRPYGSAFESLVSSMGGRNDPTGRRLIAYNSPGTICPSGWTTGGAAAKPNSTSVSVSGAFNESIAVPTGSRAVFFEPYLDGFLAALDPSETAILCCPSSYTATNGACNSGLPASVFTPTAGCANFFQDDELETVSGTWTLGGARQTVTGGLLSITGTKPLSVSTTTFSPSQAASYVGVGVVGMVILVHQASDTITAADTITASNTAPASTASSTPANNSAVRVRGSGNRVSVLAAVSCLSLVLGALFVV